MPNNSSSAMKMLSETLHAMLVLVFAYAGSHKLFNADQFSLSLRAAHLSAGWATLLAYTIPGLELAFAGLMLTPRFRTLGMWMAGALLISYTIFIVLAETIWSGLFCECVGLSPLLSWPGHGLLNIILIAIIGIRIYPLDKKAEAEKPLSTE